MRAEFRGIWDRLSDFFGKDAMPSMEEYIEIDRQDMDTQELTDTEIVQSVRSDNTPDTDSDEDLEIVGGDVAATSAEPSRPPTIHEAFKALDVLKRFATSIDECPSDVIDLGDRYETFLLSEMPKRQRQSKIDDFFVGPVNQS